MFNSGYKGIRAVDGSGIVTLKDVEVQQTSLQPEITSWSYTNGAYVPYPDTAIVGGETIVIYGSGFQNGANVYIGSTAITSTRLDQNRITFTAPSQSAGSYVLYVINPNGNAAVYAPGIYYNSYPVWNTTTYANTFIVPTSSVSFNLNATDSANLTFTLQSGSLPTGLTLYPSGLISGTTTVANTTVYTFTAVATDSFNQAAQASIIYTITYIISDPYFNQTALLLNGETNTNTYIQDTSNNNFALTVNGSATPNRFSPLWGNGYYGNYFPGGSTSYIYGGSATTILPITATTFTVECWVYTTSFTSSGGTPAMFGDMAFNASTNNWSFGPNASGQVAFYWYSGSTNYATGNTVMQLNTWYHIAVSINNNAISLFVNGVQQTITGTSTLTNRSSTLNYLCAGIWNSATNANYAFYGYISNIRVTNGIAVYTGSFTPPTTPLTAIANTILLTCQSANFVDNSTNAVTLTQAGTVTVVPNQPFGALPSSVRNYGSSLFDGSTGYLSVASAAAINLSSATAFTIEGWFYWTGVNIYSNFYNKDGAGATYPSYSVQVNGSGYLSGQIGSGNGFSSSQNITSSVSCPINQWAHFAFVLNSGTLYLYLNGTQVASATKTASIIDGGKALLIGYYASQPTNNYMAGYLSNLRIVNGTAVYTSNFTPSTAPPTPTANTSLLLLGTNTGVQDATGKNDIITVGSAKTQANTVKYGAGAMYFDGSTGYCTIPTNNNQNFTLQTGNFTIELWAYIATSSLTANFFDFRATTTNGIYPTLLLNSGALNYYVNGSTVITGSSPSISTWHHIALVRNSGTTTLYLDGTATGSAYTDSNSYLVGSAIAIGSSSYTLGSNYFNGYIDDLRITNGVARYTANFTPPTVPDLIQ